MQEDGSYTTDTVMFDGITSKYELGTTGIKPLLMFTGNIGNQVKIKTSGYRKTLAFNEESGIYVNRTIPVYPNFVKVKYGNTSDPTSYMVYKLIGTKTMFNKQLRREFITPVYLAVNKKGYNYKGHRIVEYGRTDGYAFNYFPIGITEKDIQNGNLDKMIYNNPRLNDLQKKSYYSNFVKFDPIQLDITIDYQEEDVNEDDVWTDDLDKLGEQRKKECE